jgi:ent-kaurenoic acid hydroxylase
MQIFLGGAGDAAMHALERSYTDLNYGMRAMAINLPGFAYRRALGARRRLVSVLQGVLDERRASTAKGFTRSSSVDMMADRGGGRARAEAGRRRDHRYPHHVPQRRPRVLWPHHHVGHRVPAGES